MNYYEELGVARSASVEEVRRAYRSVARLLHPDQQADETLRRLAGLQMTRLNEILETLTDPTLRREYDQGLCGQYRVLSGPPALSARSRVRWGSLTWPGATVVALGVFVLFLAHDTGTQQLAGEGSNSSGVPQDGAAGALSNWSMGRAVPRKRLPSRKDGMQAEGGLAASNEDTAELKNPLSENAGFGGAWFYATPARRAEREGLYPPESIDVEISETQGNVKGKYAAKYMVRGQPISPFVFFKFGGNARPPAANLAWSGSGGAAGHVRLTLLSARSLRVEWSIDQPGEEQSLISGTATLMRRESH